MSTSLRSRLCEWNLPELPKPSQMNPLSFTNCLPCRNRSTQSLSSSIPQHTQGSLPGRPRSRSHWKVRYRMLVLLQEGPRGEGMPEETGRHQQAERRARLGCHQHTLCSVCRSPWICSYLWWKLHYLDNRLRCFAPSLWKSTSLPQLSTSQGASGSKDCRWNLLQCRRIRHDPFQPAKRQAAYTGSTLRACFWCVSSFCTYANSGWFPHHFSG